MSLSFINGRFENTEPYKTSDARSDWFVPLEKQKYR
jgi:hypothetical protein